MQTQKHNTVHRLSSTVYAVVEKSCVPPFVGPATTQLQAAFIAGQQSVLKFLRENIVVSQDV